MRPLFLAVALLSACQIYDFEKVSPLALGQTTQGGITGRPLKPNIMLLIDRSGSMETIDPGSSTSRIAQLKSTMGPFLDQSGSLARFGLAYFPRNPRISASSMMSTNTGCSATDKVEQVGNANIELPGSATDDIATELQAHANAVRNNIAGVSTGGGTPTAESLQRVGLFAGLNANDGRQDYVLLLTDGEPNCNSNNRNKNCGTVNPRCRCTAGANCDPSGTACATGCLDTDGSVDEVKALRLREIKTVVIGFGAATTAGAGPETLQAMAEAGGYLRRCSSNTDCGSLNTCEGADPANQVKGLCQKKYFQAANGAELAKALKEILESLIPSCSYQLNQTPNDSRFIAVTVNGVNQVRGADTWKYQSGVVELTGKLCEQLQSATASSPIDVQIRVLNTL